MRTARSEDGTTIAFEQFGAGPPIILVAATLGDHSWVAPLAKALGGRFTAVTYDRRGRGASGDSSHYAVDREVEDLGALISRVGGVASLVGHSVGALLALRAAASGLPIAALALYEPPFSDGGGSPPDTALSPDPLPDSVTTRLSVQAMALHRAQSKSSEPDAEAVDGTPATTRTAIESLARPLAYDAVIMGDRSVPFAALSAVKTPTVVIDGDRSCEERRTAAREVARALPNGRHCTLVGGSHHIDADMTAPLLEEFFMRVHTNHGVSRSPTSQRPF
jgi:pimeloyl-ACP methyl ester carboxylesterase